MIERAIAVRGRGSGEVERAQNTRNAEWRAHDLHHIRIAALLVSCDLSGNGADIGLAMRKSAEACTHETRIECRQIALEIDYSFDRAFWIELPHGFEDAVRPTLVIRTCHQGFTARTAYSVADRFSVADDHNGAAIGFDGAAPDMDDHGLASDVGERFVRKPRSLQSGRDDNQIGRHGDQIARETKVSRHLGRAKCLSYKRYPRSIRAARSGLCIPGEIRHEILPN